MQPCSLILFQLLHCPLVIKKNMIPNRHVTASKDPSENGMTSASAILNSILDRCSFLAFASAIQSWRVVCQLRQHDQLAPRFLPERAKALRFHKQIEDSHSFLYLRHFNDRINRSSTLLGEFFIPATPSICHFFPIMSTCFVWNQSGHSTLIFSKTCSYFR